MSTLTSGFQDFLLFEINEPPFLGSFSSGYAILEMKNYSRYCLERYRIRHEIGYNAMLFVCMCVCVSVDNRLEREIAYSADFFQSQVPRTKRYPV